MDPLSVSASVLAVLTAALVTMKAVNETVGRYRGRDKTLSRLQGGLVDLINILTSLEEVADEESPVLVLLKGPVDRCAQLSREFEEAMKKFGAKSKTGLRDWTKMEFMRGDINEFIETLADYKSTITIGLGIITMNASRVTQQVVTDYSEMVKDTSYNLEMRLQRIDEKLSNFAVYQPALLEDSSIDLQDEKAVTEQCLRICQRANTFIQSLKDEQPTLLIEVLQEGTGQLLTQFKAQLLTQKSLSESRDNIIGTIARIQEHLNSATFSRGTERESEMLQLHKEMENAKECLEICKQASSQAATQKITIIGEVLAQDDSDQVVITSVADLFNVGKVKANNRSMQLVGSMKGDELKQMSKDRYGSRFGAVSGNLASAQQDTVAVWPENSETQKPSSSGSRSRQTKEDGGGPSLGTTYTKPSSNEVRKRRTEGEDENK